MRFFHPRFSILNPRFAAIAAAILAGLAAPTALAYERDNFGIADSVFTERAFSSGSRLFYAGPAWLLNAMPGSNRAHARYVLDRSGDLVESTTRYNGYVGTLRDVFDVGFFSNISTFAGSTGFKTSTPTALSIVGNDYYWDVNGSTDGLGGTGTWDIGVTANWNDSSGTGTPDVWTNGKNAFFQGTAGPVTLVSGLSANAWNVTVGGYTFTGGDLTVGAGNIAISNASGTTTVNSLIQGTASLTKTGAGTLTLSGNNTYTGGTKINGGILSLGSVGAIGTTGTISFGGGTLQFSASNTNDYSARFKNSTGAISLDTNGQSVGLFSVVDSSNVGGFTKLGTGTLSFLAANTYTGNTLINEGDLRVNQGGTVPTGSTILLGGTGDNSPAATFSLGETPPNVVASSLTVQASANGQGIRVLRSLANSGTNTFGGSITMNADLTVQSASNSGPTSFGTFQLNGSSINLNNHILTVNDTPLGGSPGNLNTQGKVIISALISGTDGSIVKNGGGTLILQGADNSYTGGTQIGGGVLGIDRDLSLGATSGSVQFTASATLQDTSNNVSLNASRSITIASGATAAFDSNSNTFTINGVISGTSGNLNKTGAGTLVLTGANTYTGTTTVSAGTLNAAATGAFGGTSGVTVNNGGTLLVTGSGNLNRINDSAPIVLGGATGADPIFQRSGSGVVSEGAGAQRTGPLPTNVTGTSSAGLGALSLQSNATFNFGTVGVGTFVFASFSPGTFTLDVTGWNSSNANFTASTSGIDGTDDRLIFAGVGAPNTAFITFDGAPSTALLLDTGFWEVMPLAPIPEPSTWIGGALALAAIGLMSRRRFARKAETLKT